MNILTFTISVVLFLFVLEHVNSRYLLVNINAETQTDDGGFRENDKIERTDYYKNYFYLMTDMLNFLLYSFTIKSIFYYNRLC